LIELLVVVAIVALLIGVLLPALGRARGAGQQSVCASNIRQLVIANDLYAGDHGESYAPGAVQIATLNRHRWHGSRKQGTGPFEPRGGSLTAYLDGDAASRGVRACPTFVPVMEELGRAGQGFERGCGGYGYNLAFVGSRRRAAGESERGTAWVVEADGVGSPRGWFRQPARTVAFADSAICQGRAVEYSFVEPVWWPQYPGASPDPSVHFRHGARASVAWLDGHVSAEPMSHSGSSGMYAGEPSDWGIGWFGGDGSNELFDYR